MTHRSHTNASIEEKGLVRAIPIKVYINGNWYFPGKRVFVNQHDLPTFDSFLEDLTWRLRASRAIRRLYTPNNGSRINNYDQIESDQIYVADDTNRLLRKGRYSSIEPLKQKSPRRSSDNVNPVTHNKQFQGVESRIGTINTKAIRAHICAYDCDYRCDVLFPNKCLKDMNSVISVVDDHFKRSNVPQRVDCLKRGDNGEEIRDVSELQEGGYYIVCNKCKPYKHVTFDSVKAPKDFVMHAPKLYPKARYLWQNTSGSYEKSEPQSRPRTLPPINPKRHHKHGSPDNSVTSNPEYKRKNQSREPNGVFHAKPVKHIKRTPEKHDQYSHRDDGVYNAKGQNRDTRDAREVGESHETRTDLPIDQKEAEEVKTEKIKTQKNNNAKKPKETTQKANSKKPDPDHSHGHSKKPSNKPDHKHSGTRGEFNNVSPLPGIQSDARTSTARDKAPSPIAWSDDGKDDEADLRKQNEAATKIQAGMKGHMVRKEMKQKKEEMKKEDNKAKADNEIQKNKSQTDRENEAATKIQAGFRGHKTREELKKQKAQEVNYTKGKKSGNDSLGHADEHKAATKIQSNFRGHQARKEVAERRKEKADEDKAATKIQANFRGHKARKDVEKMKEEDRQEQEKAATKIQANFRGHKVRKDIQNKKTEQNS